MSDPSPPTEEFLALQEALAGRYSLEGELGRGGMGIVYLAKDVRLDRPVAVKLLPPEMAAQPALRERFLREARTAARLSHPNIVPIHVVDEVDDFVFFVMSYVEGQTLGQRVRERGPLPPEEGVRVLREVAWALSYAHEKGVVHRDVKPENILLEAESGRAMVTDFGIAHVSRAAGLTTAGEILGTPEFMSPEQASGEEVDGRSDLYALGIVGHYALSGTLPFQAKSFQATVAKQLTQAAPPLATVASGVPGPVGSAIDRCLAKDPAERFRDGEALAEALGRIGGGRAEVPAAIRAFAEETQGQTLGMVASFAWAVAMILVTVVAAVVEGGSTPAFVYLFVAMIGGLFAVVPAGMLIHRARSLLQAGHEHDELVRALRGEVEERRKALAAHGAKDKGPLDRWLRRLTVGGLAGYLGSLAWLAFGSYVADPASVFGFYFTFGTASLFTFLGAGATSVIRSGRGKRIRGSRWLRFWDSLVGRSIFSFAGVGLGDRSSTGVSFRPTEIAIGMAAERLFEELPGDVRRSLGDLPSVVEALESHAESMRERLAGFDRVLADVGDGGRRPEPPPGSGTASPKKSGRRGRRPRSACGRS